MLYIPKIVKWSKFIHGFELPKKIRKNTFEDLSDTDIDEGVFVKSKGDYFNLNEFMKFDPIPVESDVLYGWHGVINDSAWTGWLLKISDDGDEYKISRFQKYK